MTPEPKDELASETIQPGSEDVSLPHPSFIQVAKPYIFEQTIQECITALGLNPLREEHLRLQGVTWIDNVRKALRLPVRTFNTAVVYYHKFRLVHPDNEYNFMDAAAAALLTACKVEDTLKKSREIVCAAYNLKPSSGERMAPDDPIFEGHAKGIIGLERLMLEASGFDFRSRHPQKVLIKLAKLHGLDKTSEASSLAYRISMDLYRTFAPLKQTTSTMAFSCLELAGRLLDQHIEDVETGRDYEPWKTTREEVMETLFDLLELYTHHRAATSVGPHFPPDRFLTVRISLNQEAESKKLPRHTHWTPRGPANDARLNGSRGGGRHEPTTAAEKDTTLRINPLIPAPANGEKLKVGERGREGTVRFMLDHERADAEKKHVAEYFKVEIEEYEVEE